MDILMFPFASINNTLLLIPLKVEMIQLMVVPDKILFSDKLAQTTSPEELDKMILPVVTTFFLDLIPMIGLKVEMMR